MKWNITRRLLIARCFLLFDICKKLDEYVNINAQLDIFFLIK